MPRRKRKYRQAIAEDMPADEEGAQQAPAGSAEEFAMKKEAEERDRKKQKAEAAVNGDDFEPVPPPAPAPATNGESLAIRSPDDTEGIHAELAQLRAENARLTRELAETRAALHALQAQTQAQAQRRQPADADADAHTGARRLSSVAVSSTTTSRAVSPSSTAGRSPLVHRSSLTSNSVARPAQLQPPSIGLVRRLTPSGVLPPSFSPAPRGGREGDFAKPDLAARLRESGAGKDEFTFLKRLR